MDSLYCSLEGKPFLRLLTGLSKRLFYQDSAFTNDLLAELFVGKDFERSENGQIETFEKILLLAAYNNWEVSALENKLKKISELDENLSKILIVFWTNEREKVS